jgi:hypothetical protein
LLLLLPLCTVGRWYFQQLTIALWFCHTKGYGHRDLKPGNILLASNPTNKDWHIVKLADFGLSADHVRTKAYSAVGTTTYMPPEVLRHKLGYRAPPYNPRYFDTWGLGCILYEMVTGKPAFPHNGDPLKTLLERMERGCPALPQDLPENCQKLLSRLLHPKPHERISIDEVLKHEWFVVDLERNLLVWERYALAQPPPATQQSEQEIKQIFTSAIRSAVEEEERVRASIADDAMGDGGNAAAGPKDKPLQNGHSIDLDPAAVAAAPDPLNAVPVQATGGLHLKGPIPAAAGAAAMAVELAAVELSPSHENTPKEQVQSSAAALDSQEDFTAAAWEAAAAAGLQQDGSSAGSFSSYVRLLLGPREEADRGGDGQHAN